MKLLFERFFISNLLIIGLSVASHAQDKTAGTGNWHNAGTWSPSGVPGDDDIILIPAGSVVTVLGTDHTLHNAILIIEGELIMESTCGFCFNYGSLTFTGPASGVIIEEGGKVTDGTAFGGDSHFISVQGETFWSGDDCSSNCGTHEGNYTAPAGGSSEPEELSNPLPVEMLYFTGNFSEGAVLLKWATAAELNNSHFEIDRSVDNFDFHKIGEVKGNGNSNTRIEYSFRDNALPLVYNVLYYRIKQVDFDGQYVYHEFIAVTNETHESMVMKTWPSPFDEQLTVILRSSSPDNIKVGLYNMEGQEVFSHFYPVNEGLNELAIDKLYDSPPGIYALYLIGNSFYFKEKVVKSR
jgi:hypothetical protein